jgi:hypothetical protein
LKIFFLQRSDWLSVLIVNEAQKLDRASGSSLASPARNSGYPSFCASLLIVFENFVFVYLEQWLVFLIFMSNPKNRPINDWVIQQVLSAFNKKIKTNQLVSTWALMSKILILIALISFRPFKALKMIFKIIKCVSKVSEEKAFLKLW